jgi:hypothetical protein
VSYWLLLQGQWQFGIQPVLSLRPQVDGYACCVEKTASIDLRPQLIQQVECGEPCCSVASRLPRGLNWKSQHRGWPGPAACWLCKPASDTVGLGTCAELRLILMCSRGVPDARRLSPESFIRVATSTTHLSMTSGAAMAHAGIRTAWTPAVGFSPYYLISVAPSGNSSRLGVCRPFFKRQASRRSAL